MNSNNIFNYIISLFAETAINFTTILEILDPLLILLPVLLSVAFMTIIERKQLAAHQRRIGPAMCSRKTLNWVKPSNSGDSLYFLFCYIKLISK